MRSIALRLLVLFAPVLACRGDGIDNLLKQLAETTSPETRVELIGTELFRAYDPRIKASFKKLLSERTDKEGLYVAWYLAKYGDLDALHVLNQNFGRYDCSSYEWSYVLPLFGMYNYKPAIPQLIVSLEHVSGNVIEGAATSLGLFYPGAPKFKSPSEAKDYYLKKHQAVSGKQHPSINENSSQSRQPIRLPPKRPN